MSYHPWGVRRCEIGWGRGTLEDWFQALRAGEASLNPSLSRDYFLKLLKDPQCPFSYLHVKMLLDVLLFFKKYRFF